MGPVETEHSLYPKIMVHIHLPREIAFQGLQADKKWQVINEAPVSKDKWPPEDRQASKILMGVMQAKACLPKTSCTQQTCAHVYTYTSIHVHICGTETISRLLGKETEAPLKLKSCLFLQHSATYLISLSLFLKYKTEKIILPTL